MPRYGGSRLRVWPTSRSLQDGPTIHRFEIGVELMWKALKRALEFESLSPETLGETLKEAFRVGWLHDEAIGLDMVDHRNTSPRNHLATERVARNYATIAAITPTIRTTLDFLKARHDPLE